MIISNKINFDCIHSHLSSVGAEHGGERGLELGDLGGDVLVQQRGALDVGQRHDQAVTLELRFDLNLPPKIIMPLTYLRERNVLWHGQVARPTHRDHEVLLVPPRPQASRAVLQSSAINCEQGIFQYICGFA